nr:unnamed protein product [Digitaria exilis]
MQVTCSVKNSHSPSLYTGAFTSSYTHSPRYRSHVSGTLTTVLSAAVSAAAFADDAFSAASSSARLLASSAPPPPVTVGSVTSLSFSCTTSTTAAALPLEVAVAVAVAVELEGSLEDADDDLLAALGEGVDGGVGGGLGLLEEVEVGGLGAGGAGGELERNVAKTKSANTSAASDSGAPFLRAATPAPSAACFIANGADANTDLRRCCISPGGGGLRARARARFIRTNSPVR